jgi:glycosyltransferase involved in cell wall biosynthesis
MKIAILGTRGIPARYGGFETFAEHISTQLAERGHQVTVYCRRAFARPDDTVDSRVRRVTLPSICSKYLDTLSHAFLSTLHVVFTDAEVVLFCNVANSPFAWIPRLFGKPVILNVDGLDRKRRKWNFLGRLYLLLCEWIATVAPSKLVTDAKVIQEYFWRRYRKHSTMITYGAEVPPGTNDLDGFRLPSGKFLLYVSRLEPENNPELVIRAFSKVTTDWPLVVVGGNPYNPAYVSHLKSIADSRVIFTGPIYGDAYWRIQRNAGAYICASEVGGTHPGLVEAMAAGNAILYCGTPENRETMGECGIPFEPRADDLTSKMHVAVRDAELRGQLRCRAKERAQVTCSWGSVARQYEDLMRRALRKPVPDAPFVPSK